jgi:DNA-binding NarL/FixJ family response regulator
MRITGSAGDVHAASAISIVLVGEHVILREGLRKLLEQEPGFRIVGEVSDPGEDATVAQMHEPIVLLVGFSGRPLIRAMRALHEFAPDGARNRTIVLATKLHKTHVAQARQLGVAEILLKDTTTRTVFETVRSVAATRQGDRSSAAISTASASSDCDGNANGSAAKLPFGLTSRELDIVGAVRRGDSNRAIARRFSLSEDTVKHHLTRVFDKTGVFSRLELAMFAIKHDLGHDAPADASGSGESV